MAVINRPLKIVGGGILVVAAVAAALLLGAKLIPALPAINDPGMDYWAVGHRTLTVSDRTGDAAWHAAISQGIATWAGAGTELRLTLVTHTGPCRQVLDTIEVCARSQRQLTTAEIPGEEGTVEPRANHQHQFHSVVIIVCSDCPVDQPRRVIIATHELGHALGLPHNGSPFSVMYPTGGAFGPDTQDLQLLHSKDG
jgi:predicted Zn-dependent protease